MSHTNSHHSADLCGTPNVAREIFRLSLVQSFHQLACRRKNLTLTRIVFKTPLQNVVPTHLLLHYALPSLVFALPNHGTRSAAACCRELNCDSSSALPFIACS